MARSVVGTGGSRFPAGRWTPRSRPGPPTTLPPKAITTDRRSQQPAPMISRQDPRQRLGGFRLPAGTSA